MKRNLLETKLVSSIHLLFSILKSTFLLSFFTNGFFNCVILLLQKYPTITPSSSSGIENLQTLMSHHQKLQIFSYQKKLFQYEYSFINLFCFLTQI